MDQIKQPRQSSRKKLFRIKNRFNYSKEDLLIKTVLILIIIFLSNNIYIAYNKGVENKNLISQEEQKLSELRSEAEKLEYLERYYSSIEFKRIYARESQNLAEPGETLFYINRPEEIKIDYYEDNSDPIVVNEHAKWWRKLIFGI